MNMDPKAERPAQESSKVKKNRAAPQKSKKKENEKQFHVFSEVMEEANKIDLEKPKAFEEFLFLFNAVRRLKNLTNKQVEDFFTLVNAKIESLWVPFLTKATVILCLGKTENDSKLIYAIRTISRARFAEYGVLESGLAMAEKNLCNCCDGNFVTQFLKDAQKQNNKHEKQIPNSELACLSFICFSLYCKLSFEGDPKIQLLIDRAIAEFFSAYELSGIKEKDLAGKTLGNALSSKVFSPKKISELTYLYLGNTEKIQELSEKIIHLEEVRKNQSEYITTLRAELKAVNTRNHDLLEENSGLRSEIQQLTEERNAAENMLDFEKNKYELQLKTRSSGLAKQLTYEIGLELETLRDLVEGLDSNNQRRFGRRLDSIEQYLREFGGEE